MGFWIDDKGRPVSGLWVVGWTLCYNMTSLSDHLVCLNVGLEPPTVRGLHVLWCLQLKNEEKWCGWLGLRGSRTARRPLAAGELILLFIVQCCWLDIGTGYCLNLGLGHFREVS